MATEPVGPTDRLHVHDECCGHAVVRHGDHSDFLHDGRLHRVGGIMEDCADCPDEIHAPHSGHMHVHGPDCGHEALVHAEHIDYIHGKHRHRQHELHYDEH